MDPVLLQLFYGGVEELPVFCFDQLTGPSVNQLLTQEDVDRLRYIATSVKLAPKTNLKFEQIDSIMRNRGFRRLAGGTNRLVYRHLEIPGIVVKVAYDSEGITNNPDEFRNQELLKPFCTKVFDVTPCGTVGVFERVDRITSRYEFGTIADDVYDLITNIVGKYVVADIGTKFMYNYGVRLGFGPVLLDFPYIYELDGSKIYCGNVMDNGHACGGEIGYDDGFNFLTCSKCGRVFNAKELSKPRKKSGMFVHAKKKGAVNMKVVAMRGDNVVRTKEFKDQTQFMKSKKSQRPRRQEKIAIGKTPIAHGTKGHTAIEAAEETRTVYTDEPKKSGINFLPVAKAVRVPREQLVQREEEIKKADTLRRYSAMGIITAVADETVVKRNDTQEEKKVEEPIAEEAPVVETEESDVVEVEFNVELVEEDPVVEEKLEAEESVDGRNTINVPVDHNLNDDVEIIDPPTADFEEDVYEVARPKYSKARARRVVIDGELNYR